MGRDNSPYLQSQPPATSHWQARDYHSFKRFSRDFQEIFKRFPRDFQEIFNINSTIFQPSFNRIAKRLQVNLNRTSRELHYKDFKWSWLPITIWMVLQIKIGCTVKYYPGLQNLQAPRLYDCIRSMWSHEEFISFLPPNPLL